MISFVWSSKYPFLAGTGGSENYTAGHIRELQRRGIPTRILTLGHGTRDGREDFPDITFQALGSKEELSVLDDTLIFITYPLNVVTKRLSYVALHCPLTSLGGRDPLFDPEGARDKKLITPSTFAADMWGKHLGASQKNITAVYPFAETCFSQVKRPKKTTDKVRILFGGRLTPDKGIYTLLASLHMGALKDIPFELTATTACSHSEEGKIVRTLLEAHPLVNVVPARRSPEAMAELMAEHDMLVMPSTDIFWREAFGILSVEAQHAGCRVVGSNAGGIPETDCGGLVLVKADDPQALAAGMAQAATMGPLTTSERALASKKFTVKASVNRLLRTIGQGQEIKSALIPQKVLPHVHAVRQRLRRQGQQLIESVDHLTQDTYEAIGQVSIPSVRAKN